MLYFILLAKLRPFIKNSVKTSLEFFDLYQLEYNGESINLYISHKSAGKASCILCTEGGDVIWEQLYPFGGMSRPAREKKYALKPICDKNAITVVVVRRNPQEIIGLDIGFFQSGKMPLEFGNAYLVTENEFCLLQNLFIEKGEPK